MRPIAEGPVAEHVANSFQPDQKTRELCRWCLNYNKFQVNLAAAAVFFGKRLMRMYIRGGSKFN